MPSGTLALASCEPIPPGNRINVLRSLVEFFLCRWMNSGDLGIKMLKLLFISVLCVAH